MRPVNRAAHAACDACRRVNKRKRYSNSQSSNERKVSVVYDPSGDFARGALIPIQQVRATAKLGNWPAGIVFV